jgi:hypothetical protein
MLATAKLPVPKSRAVCCANVKQHAVRDGIAGCRARCVAGRPLRGFRSHPMVFGPPGSGLRGCVPRRKLCPCLVRALWRNGGLSPRSSNWLLAPSNGAHRANGLKRGPSRAVGDDPFLTLVTVVGAGSSQRELLRRLENQPVSCTTFWFAKRMVGHRSSRPDCRLSHILSQMASR